MCLGFGPSGDSGGSAPAPSAGRAAVLPAAAAAAAAARATADAELTVNGLLEAEDREAARELDMAQAQMASAQVQHASVQAQCDAALLRLRLANCCPNAPSPKWRWFGICAAGCV